MATDLPKSVWSGSFILGNVEMRCHVLDNGQRIIEAESMAALFDDEVDLMDLDMTEFARWMRGE